LVLASAVTFASDIIESKSWWFGIASYGCELPSVDLEEAVMGGRDVRASEL
jgi:hypothetical protein